MPLPANGKLTMDQIHAEYGLGKNLNAYRGKQHYKVNSIDQPYFPTGAISFSDFYNTSATDPVVESSQTFSGVGAFSWTVPMYRYLRIRIYGASGGGGGSGFDNGFPGTDGTSATNSTVTGTNVSLAASGGTGGKTTYGGSGSPGVGSGGTTNTTGGGQRGGAGGTYGATAGGRGGDGGFTELIISLTNGPPVGEALSLFLGTKGNGGNGQVRGSDGSNARITVEVFKNYPTT